MNGDIEIYRERHFIYIYIEREREREREKERMGYYSAFKKKEILAVCDNLGEP